MNGFFLLVSNSCHSFIIFTVDKHLSVLSEYFMGRASHLKNNMLVICSKFKISENNFLNYIVAT